MLRVPEVGSGLASFAPRLLFPLVPCRASLQHPPGPVLRLHTPHPRPVRGRAEQQGEVSARPRRPGGVSAPFRFCFTSLSPRLLRCLRADALGMWGDVLAGGLAEFALLPLCSARIPNLGEGAPAREPPAPKRITEPVFPEDFWQVGILLAAVDKTPAGWEMPVLRLPSGPGTQPLGLAFGDGAGRSWCWTPRLISSLQVGKKPN